MEGKLMEGWRGREEEEGIDKSSWTG